MSGPDPRSYDAIVIGTGQAGKPLARALAGAGKKTAIVERDQVGGTCVNYGCTPTKTMVASARVAYLARRAADYGVHTGPVEVRLEEVIERKREVVTRWREGSRKGLEQTKQLDLLLGEASFEGPRTVRVRLSDGGEARLEADRVFINTGTRPRKPDVEGLDQIPALDNASIMELDTLPEHLVILGGGYIGIEFGQMFRRFGSEVTIVQRRGQLLPREDEDVAAAIADILREDGVDLILGAQPIQAAQEGDGTLRLDLEVDGGERTLHGTHVLVAAGRAPNTEVLNLGSAGVETDPRGFVKVDERLETTTEGIWALGDVKGGPEFTHISYDDFRVVRSNLLGAGGASIRGRLVPYTVFMDPQLGRVGVTEAEARKAGGRILVAKLPMSNVARAVETGETRGFMKAVVDAETWRILGFAALGIEGGEIASAVQVAMIGDLPYTALKEGVFAHPTLAESLNNLFAALD